MGIFPEPLKQSKKRQEAKDIINRQSRK